MTIHAAHGVPVAVTFLTWQAEAVSNYGYMRRQKGEVAPPESEHWQGT